MFLNTENKCWLGRHTLVLIHISICIIFFFYIVIFGVIQSKKIDYTVSIMVYGPLTISPPIVYSRVEQYFYYQKYENTW